MIPVRCPKGYDLNVTGKPSAELKTLADPKTVAVLPERIPFVKPMLTVKAGDRVRIGSPLFTDKRRPWLKFVSPGSGAIREVALGPRRVIQQIVIDLDDAETGESVDPVTVSDLEEMPRAELVERLADGGVWPLLRMLPFRDIAPAEGEPPAIFVGLDAREPFQPAPEVYLAGCRDTFGFGLALLRRLCPNLVVHAGSAVIAALPAYADLITHTVDGVYPADDPGVVLYHLRRESGDNRSWFVSGQDLLVMARFLAEGRLPTERIVAVAGSCLGERHHVKTRLGAPLRHLLPASGSDCHEARYVVGGLLRGYRARAGDHLGLYETAVSLVPEPHEKEFLGFVRPGFRKPSYSKTFLSRWNRKPLEMNTNRNGGLRACIACGYCAEVCPVDIWPQMTLKAILADEVEEYLAHGLLDCVECGLCSYVCPSKIELAETLRDTKRSYYNELGLT